MPCIVVRYLLISYRLQQATLGRRNEVSDFFTVSNGVKQGSVLLAVLYCVYTNLFLFMDTNSQAENCGRIYLCSPSTPRRVCS